MLQMPTCSERMIDLQHQCDQWTLDRQMHKLVKHDGRSCARLREHFVQARRREALFILVQRHLRTRSNTSITPIMQQCYMCKRLDLKENPQKYAFTQGLELMRKKCCERL